MLKIYCDGIFDLFHLGHLNHLKKIREYFKKEIYLIVGIVNDNKSKSYKRKPIFNENQRKEILLACKYTDQVILINNLSITEEFINKYNIDYVVHAFSDKNDINKQKYFFKIPIKLNKLIVLEYNHGISSTKIINKDFLNWNEIWNKKGLIETDDLYLLNGWEKTNFDANILINKIIKKLNIKENESIIEIGCGSGLLSTFLKKYKYIGIDKSLSLVNKHIKLLRNIALNFSCTENIFKKKYFDYCICNSMLEYLDDFNELNKTINEMEYITKYGIYIGSIRYKTHKYKKEKHKLKGVFNHLIIPKEYFIKRGYNIIECLYEKEERYDAYKIL